MASYPTRSAQVTAALKKAGYKVELVRGDGYWYFLGDDAECLAEQGVYGTYRIGELTIDQWVAIFKERFDAAQ